LNPAVVVAVGAVLQIVGPFGGRLGDEVVVSMSVEVEFVVTAVEKQLAQKEQR